MPGAEPYLIKKFLQNKCTPEEAAQVCDYLTENPTVLEQYLSEKEWADLKITRKLSPTEIKNIKITIDAHISRGAKILSLGRLKKYLVAASILAVVAFASVRFFYNKEDGTQWVRLKFNVIHNATFNNLDTILPDGSLISLRPGASVKYYDDYLINREVKVNGKVIFEEKKIAGHPFKVIAQDIVTIPVGTRFSVNSIEKLKQVIIHLLEGKVVVNAEDNSLKSEKIYLKPGEILTIDKINQTFIVKNTNQSNLAKVPIANSPSASKAKKESNTKVIWTNNAIRFNQASLSGVFDKISFQQNVPIIYEKEMLSNYHFTGDIYYNDDINKLLKNICEVNGLDFKNQNDSIFIFKAAHKP